MSLGEVPVLDLGATPRADAAAVVDAALRRYGFFYVTNHGVPPALVAQQFRVAEQIFALPDAVKRSFPFDAALDIGAFAPSQPCSKLRPRGAHLLY